MTIGSNERKKRGWSARFAIALAGVLLVASRAEAASPADRAAAQGLFDEGMKLLQAQRYAEACPKLEESNRLDPAIGTRFNLADCYEHVGKTASAWTLFLDVAAATRAAGQPDREQVARDRAKALESRLARMTIVVDGRETPGLVIKRDGTALDPPTWGTPLPIDAGDHLIVASAPRKTSWQATVRVGDGANASVNVPALQDGPADAGGVVDSSSPETAATRWSTQRYLGITAAGVGVGGIAVGSVLGLMAKSKNDEARNGVNCSKPSTCTPVGFMLIQQAEGLATGSTIAMIAGGVFAAGGVVLFLTAPPGPSASTVGFTIVTGPTGAVGSFKGSF